MSEYLNRCQELIQFYKLCGQWFIHDFILLTFHNHQTNFFLLKYSDSRLILVKCLSHSFKFISNVIQQWTKKDSILC